MNTEEIISMADSCFINTYSRYKIVLESGDGVRLTAKDGKEYLDFGAGIAVFAFGYNNKEFNDAIKAQVDKLIHTSNMFYNEPAAKAAKALTDLVKMDRVFFTNSGTEANEGALKLAKKYGYLKDNRHDHEIIAMHHSFHGRSMGSLALTGNTAYQASFGPMISGIRFAEFNDIESVEALVNEKTSAIFMETVQGEGGIYPADIEFLKRIREICDKHDILLILDEIQCGLGRTGELLACDRYGVSPDVVTLAKALGQGIAVGAFLAKGKAADVLSVGDHGSTYGGSPLAGAAVLKTIEMIKERDIVSHVRNTAPYLEKKLDDLKEKYECIIDRRGVGFMQGLVVSVPAGKVIEKALENGLILFSAGANVVRFVPPLIITEEDIDEMAVKLDKAFAEL